MRAFRVARAITRHEGILVGGSSGTAVFAALEVARELDEDKVVVVILPDTVGDAAEMVANRLRVAVSEIDLVQADGTAIPRITISLGGGSLRSGQTMKALLGHADEALYQSKANGRDRVTFAVSLS